MTVRIGSGECRLGRVAAPLGMMDLLDGEYELGWLYRLFLWLDSDHRGYMDLHMCLK